ncbi:hypothetical protein [Sphingomonas montanisoli]|uniref:DUF1493 family protein n=1 Tax=Sphingomonas montanisoli TaxID=2606412 RepID=A0A5D9C8M4_9SPHN|nr:hypothetical protein [Sphingomonas montanisoli]TZG27482.1 hypothetical protein FYJ91_07780 [Sphingomonas montanisoli]
MNLATLDRVIELAREQSGLRRISSDMAIDQDIRMSGGDATDFAEALAAEFGEGVWRWPWQRFAELNEGLGIFVLLALLWYLLTWPIRGRFLPPSKFERLELGHIARVINAGHWIEP